MKIKAICLEHISPDGKPYDFHQIKMSIETDDGIKHQVLRCFHNNDFFSRVDMIFGIVADEFKRSMREMYPVKIKDLSND